VAKPDLNITRSEKITAAEMLAAYSAWSAAAIKNPAPLHLEIDRWTVSDDFSLELESSEANADIKARFYNSPNIAPTTVEVASGEAMNSNMLQSALDQIKEWDEYKNNVQPMKSLVDDLFQRVRQYNLACESEMTDNQLYELQLQIRNGERERDDITNTFKTWMYYKNTLAEEYMDLLTTIPMPQEKKFSFYRNADKWNPNGHCNECSSNPLRDLVDGETYSFQKPEKFSIENSFCASTLPIPGMTEYVIARRAGPPESHKIVSRKDYNDNIDGFRELEKFWAHSNASDAGPNARVIDILVSKKNNKRNYLLAGNYGSSGARNFNYEDTFYANRVANNAPCPVKKNAFIELF
jgi:hypothetical protein